ncbi:MAG: copper chaperone PCu(A)C [Paracoccaceae bacterium]
MRNTLLKIAFLSGLALTPVSAIAEAVISVEKPWARASIGTKRPSAAYMILENSGDTAVKLIGASSAVSGMTEIHKTEMDANGVARMMPAGDIEILPGASVTLKKGGLHIMLMKLNTALIEGETVDVTLNFDDGSETTVTMPIKAMGATGHGH